jgi:NADP-dependent 3-hydroxy acid dehydrogenase YdfG
MDAKLVYLLYAQENKELASEVLDHFDQSNVHLSPNPDAANLELAIQEDASTPVLMLISDNFLRSLSAMDRLSIIIQEPSNQLIPVLIDGRKLREGTEDVYEHYPTKIGTIHEVMQYRDFWYEEWIRLRKASNHAEGDELELLEKQKNIAKRMSTNIGTFLRNINGLKPLSYEQFTDAEYQAFLDKIEVAALVKDQKNEHLKVLEDEEVVEETQEYSTEEEKDNEIQMEAGTYTEEVTELEENVDETTEELVEENAEETVEEEAALELTNEQEESLVEEVVEEAEAAVDPIEEMMSDLDHEDETEELEETQLEGEEEENSTETEEVFADMPEAHEEVNDEETDVTEEEVFEMPNLRNVEEIDEEAIYEQVNLQEVDDLDVLFYLAETETEEGDFDNAAHCYRRILKLDPTNGRALLWLARLENRKEEVDKPLVADLYRKALFCNEESAEIYYEYALFLKDKYQSLHRSTDLLHRALELNPSFELAYIELADCQLKLGQREQARANYLQACALNDSYQSAELDAVYGVFRPQVMEEEVAVEAEADEAKPPHPNSEKVVMVTGATSGIGRAIAELFAFNGYKVILTGRRAERLQELEAELESKFEVNLQTLSFDVRDIAAVQEAIETLPESWRNVDILINNAGLAKGRAPIHQGELVHWETMIDTNIKGLLYLTRMVTPGMVERGSGFVLNIGSVAGKNAYPDGNVYCATKAAVDMLTRAMRLDLHKHGIRVSAIHPGHVETEFALVRFEGDEEKAAIYDDFTPLTAYDVAEVVYFVASRPERVNIQDVVMFSTQQASVTITDKSGRKYD